MSIKNHPKYKLLDEIETWVFDLDNTLYPSNSKLFDQVSKRIGLYISKNLNIPITEARIVQKDFFHKYGTTLRGLMLEHKINPDEFLAYVHDIDFSTLSLANDLDNALNNIDGRKIVFTNADSSYASKVLIQLGLENHFSEIFDIVAADYIPKPNPEAYKIFIKKHDFDPNTAIFFEDILRNLGPAKEMGMTTVWIKNNDTWALPGSDGVEAHYQTKNLGVWLNSISTS
ncbi:MAG: pyrimidine 5'-nucleotidase [Alphaproteobacteria bacterium]|nr:pyrimidine 5'-nucleotidase [Alphaproteobacteria bacterium]|tara:strand:+ start:40 stop:726 length:687 start_codon:yes stop_codon:yes gene_type:complete